MTQKILVGLDIGGTTVKIAFLDMDGEFIHKWEIPTDKSDGGINVVGDIAKAIDEKMNELGLAKEQFVGIGAGAPGPFELETGLIYNAVNIGWKNYPLKALLEEKTGLPVVADNDANVAAAGEMWKGAGNGAKDVVCVTLGTGVGGGIITNGKIVQGVKGAGGEIGHMTAIPQNGAPCNCGKTGCLETVASATGIARIATEKVKAGEESGLQAVYQASGTITAKDVFDAAYADDKLAKEVVDHIAFHLGLSLSHLANTLNPEKIIIGGGVSKAGDILINSLKHYFEQFCFSTVRESTSIAIATLGNDAGVIGAAYLAKTEL